MARSMVTWSAVALLVAGFGTAAWILGGCDGMPCHQASAGGVGCSMHGGQHAPPAAKAVNPEGSAGTVQAAAAKPVNTRCPIMGGKINADNVQTSLTRTFNGQTVAFCCGGCPGQWDKLADQDKQATLAKAL